jgi:serine/threonine protein kinase
MDYLERTRCRLKVGTRFECSGEVYEIGGKIGNGAAGLVRKAKRLGDGMQCAVKFLAPDGNYINPEHFDDVARRFKREGQRGLRLEHKNLVRILGYDDNKSGIEADTAGHWPERGTVDQPLGDRDPELLYNPLIVMEYLRGKTLDSYIHHRAVAGLTVLAANKDDLLISLNVAYGLKYLAAHRLVHRDVKCANVFLANESGMVSAKLGDFGVVKWGDFNASLSTGILTTTGQAGLGTMKYAAPEAAVSPKDVASHSDVFSFGLVLLELFTHAILPTQQHVYDVMMAAASTGNVRERCESFGVRVAPNHDQLASLVLSMVHRQPGQRPTIDSVVIGLERAHDLLIGA